MIRIAKAEVSDIPAIKQVLSTTWHDTYGFFLGDSAIDRVTSEWHSPNTLQNEIERDSTFMGVAKSDQDISAMITAHEDGLLLFVSRLYVLPGHQRRGVGKKLLEAGYSAFPGTERVRLEVEEQNPVGRAFYRKLGFTGERESSSRCAAGEYDFRRNTCADSVDVFGSLPFGKVRLVQAWIEIHREELMADWQLAVNGEEAFKIEPLK